MRFPSIAVALVTACAGGLAAELNDSLAPSLDHPSIGYRARETDDPVAVLNRKLRSGAVRLKYEEPAGYLRSVLEALNIPVESQMAVFSKTSLQAPLINLHNPRTLFFNDSVVAGWMHGGFIELASLDPRRGVMFYVLPQTSSKPEFQRRQDCLQCHVSDATLGVPGMMIRSTFTAPDNTLKLIFGASLTDHRTPLEDRWGGWYVTGLSGANRHLGNAVVTGDDPKTMVTAATLHVATLKDRFETSKYLSPYSDVAALMVFDHQMHMTNLITRVGWQARASLTSSLADAARELADYLFFIDEAPLKDPIRGTSGFTETFAAQGPRDPKGRSLRDLDLQRRVFRYPCSYMIYSEAFDALPAEAKDAIYRRMWQILSGGEQGARYAKLTVADRRAILEILRDTKKELPVYFQRTAMR